MRFALLLLASTLLAPGDAAASHAPNVWERVIHPEAVAEERARTEVERLLFEAELLGPQGPSANDRLRLALLTLESADAAHARDIRLRFQLGRLLGLLGQHARAVEILEPALDEAPLHPMAADAAFRLAIASTWLGHREREIAMYDRFLALVTSKQARAVALSNRAEAKMTQGDLPAAIADYRASLAIDPDPVALRGLAVALDRSGNFGAALREADRALSLDPDGLRLHGDGIFFLPAYEVHWYDALDAVARARSAELAPEACLAWKGAAGHYALFIEAASADDRWLAIAKARRLACERAAARCLVLFSARPTKEAPRRVGP